MRKEGSRVAERISRHGIVRFFCIRVKCPPGMPILLLLVAGICVPNSQSLLIFHGGN